jgi:hypothetical protein
VLWLYSFGDWWIMNQEIRSCQRKTCPSAILSTKNPIVVALGSKPCLRNERPTTNCRSHGTVLASLLILGRRTTLSSKWHVKKCTPAFSILLFFIMPKIRVHVKLRFHCFSIELWQRRTKTEAFLLWGWFRVTQNYWLHWISYKRHCASRTTVDT